MRDNIGEVSRNVLTVRLHCPANISEMTRYHWSGAITIAPSVTHEGAKYVSRVVPMTAVDPLPDSKFLEREKE